MVDEMAWLPYVVTAFVTGVPALVGAALMVVAVGRWRKLRALGASGQHATARVVDNQVESWSGGRMTFRPVVTFRTGAGREVTAVLADLGGYRSHVVGTEIDVRYDPQRPTEAAPARTGHAGLVIALLFGLVFLAFSVCAYQVADLVLSVFRDVGGFTDIGNPGDLGDPDFDEFDWP
jgi:hypothetical protein